MLRLKDADRAMRSTEPMQDIIDRPQIATRRAPVPRGIARTGPPLLSYGFRPFFLLAAAFALLAMIAWIGALTFGWDVGGSYGALNWHAHEMLFGYTSAALAGFMLTAIPNWTGRLPVSGLRLLGLVALWLAGRAAMAMPDTLGVVPSVVIDAGFLPVMAIIAGREIVAGKNWKNLKILGGLTGLALANAAFHWEAIALGQALEASRLAIGVYLVLIATIGGRIVPSFTRNWLVKAGSSRLPAAFGPFDVGSIVVLGCALIAWVLLDESLPSAGLALAASVVQAVRLSRWVGWRTVDEPLLLILHVGYAFVPIGMLCVGLSELGWLSPPSALHVLTVGAIGVMTFGVMTRASLGHTGRPLTASANITVAYLAMIIAATIRPFAELLPAQYHLMLGAAGLCWIAAFVVFLAEYGPMLCRRGVR